MYLYYYDRPTIDSSQDIKKNNILFRTDSNKLLFYVCATVIVALRKKKIFEIFLFV